MTEFLFERLNAANVFFMKAPVLACFATGTFFFIQDVPLRSLLTLVKTSLDQWQYTKVSVSTNLPGWLLMEGAIWVCSFNDSSLASLVRKSQISMPFQAETTVNLSLNFSNSNFLKTSRNLSPWESKKNLLRLKRLQWNTSFRIRTW